jgi:NADPH-dependent 2,4-dienoyl-CoA reductase/sulfur reductase-like enzyme
MKHIVIIGNGIAGITTARHVRKLSDARITVISSETKHFFARTALMYVYMGHMKFEHTKPYEDFFWEKNRIELIQDKVMSVDFKAQQLNLEQGQALHYDQLVITTGSKPNKFGWTGQDLPGVQGLYSFQDLQLLEANTHPCDADELNRQVKRAVIVGGGLIGVELAEMLLTRNIKVTFLVRESRFWGGVLPKEDAALISAHLKEHEVDLRFNEELDAILPGSNGRVGSVRTKSGEIINCELVGLTAGVSPNVDFLRGSELQINKGIVVNQLLETNIANVFASGDCAEIEKPSFGHKSIEAVWYTGRMMGEVLAQTLCGKPTPYSPGPWFNSAKFFDIEYQTYGNVSAERLPNENRFYWQHPTKNAAIHVVWDATTDRFIGINTFGIRMRHELFHNWLSAGAGINEVMTGLTNANFDTEFYKRFENEITPAFNRETGRDLLLEKRSWKKIFNLKNN